MGGARALLLVAFASAAAVLTSEAIPAAPAPARAETPIPTISRTLAEPGKGMIETHTFWSSSLNRAMPYRVYLPPGYAGGSRRYPTLYLLHGMSASDSQWEDLGVAGAADDLIAKGAIAPLIIVMPEGENAYWVDHATDGQLWGRYTAVDVVADVDANLRSIPQPRSRAIGGLSMGAHGALQLALNYPGEFGAVGAHSLVLRRLGNTPPYFGGSVDFAKRDPVQLVRSKSCSFALWIDIGNEDPWATNALQFDAELSQLGVHHEWHLWSGGHSDAYWKAHLADYLGFYARAFARKPARTTLS